MKLYVPVFSLTLLLSAALLFSIQPMFSKMLLPLLGGTPQVWNTAMVFFQACLLGGYAYAHITSRFLDRRVQAALHIIILVAFTVILPVTIPAGWEPDLTQNPTFWQLSVMAIAVGGPFFVVSGSAPMLQHWFAATDHKDAHNPYFLYGASNLGSMAALLSYPVIIEPMMGISEQSETWMYGYFTLIVLTALCAMLVWTCARNIKEKSTANNDVPAVTRNQRLKWLALSFIPSSLMLGVTTYITTDIASVPLFWIAPFALYVCTFIIVFARTQILTPTSAGIISGLAAILLVVQMIALKEFVHNYPLILVGTHVVAFFMIALACHYDLAQSKPHAKYLTEFYFFMSLGGVLGGAFNALLAPNLFLLPMEYSLALAAAMLMRYSSRPTNEKLVIDLKTVASVLGLAGLCYGGYFLILSKQGAALLICSIFVAAIYLYLINTRWLFGLSIAASLIISPITYSFSIFVTDKTVYIGRNFFGIHKVVESEKSRSFVSGQTDHGTQPVNYKHRLERVSYYSEYSPLTDVFDYLDMHGDNEQKVAVLGLGIGVMACYTREGRSFDFFEIDKDVVDIAQNTKFFTYLSDCGSPHEIYVGDGRLELEKQPDKKYTLIVTDAFSSDNIPVHIMTLEAIEMYMQKLEDDGILVIHVSNNFVDLEPIVAEIAKKLDVPALGKLVFKTHPIGDTGIESYPAHFVVLTKSSTVLEYLRNEKEDWTDAIFREGIHAWTDKYSNIISVLGNITAKKTRPKMYFDARPNTEEDQEEEKIAEEEATEAEDTTSSP